MKFFVFMLLACHLFADSIWKSEEGVFIKIVDSNPKALLVSEPESDFHEMGVEGNDGLFQGSEEDEKFSFTDEKKDSISFNIIIAGTTVFSMPLAKSSQAEYDESKALAGEFQKKIKHKWSLTDVKVYTKEDNKENVSFQIRADAGFLEEAIDTFKKRSSLTPEENEPFDIDMVHADRSKAVISVETYYDEDDNSYVDACFLPLELNIRNSDSVFLNQKYEVHYDIVQTQELREIRIQDCTSFISGQDRFKATTYTIREIDSNTLVIETYYETGEDSDLQKVFTQLTYRN